MKRERPPVPEGLDNAAYRKLVAWLKVEVRFDKRYGRFCTDAALRHVVGETLDWHRARGNPHGHHDWIAVVRNRLRDLATEGEYWLRRKGRTTYEHAELPQEARPAKAEQGELIAIAPVIDMLTGRKRA
jgi:hypothetical protein